MGVREEGDKEERESLGLGHKNGERRRGIGWGRGRGEKEVKMPQKSEISEVYKKIKGWD